MKIHGRGYSEVIISSDGDVVLSKWFDNKCVSMGSNFIRKGHEDTCKTWDTQRKVYSSHTTRSD